MGEGERKLVPLKKLVNPPLSIAVDGTNTVHNHSSASDRVSEEHECTLGPC